MTLSGSRMNRVAAPFGERNEAKRDADCGVPHRNAPTRKGRHRTE
jgi:hypothetical protein